MAYAGIAAIWGALVALFGVLQLGILKGLIVAVALTLVAVMRRLSAPQAFVLGRLECPGILSMSIAIRRQGRFLTSSYSGRMACCFLQMRIAFVTGYSSSRSKQAGHSRQFTNLEASPEIDVTSLEMLEQLRSELQEWEIAALLRTRRRSSSRSLRSKRIHRSSWTESDLSWSSFSRRRISQRRLSREWNYKGESVTRSIHERLAKSDSPLLKPMKRISRMPFRLIRVLNLEHVEIVKSVRKLCQD